MSEASKRSAATRMSPDCTPFSEDRFRQTESVRERDDRARSEVIKRAAENDEFDSQPEPGEELEQTLLPEESAS